MRMAVRDTKETQLNFFHTLVPGREDSGSASDVRFASSGVTDVRKDGVGDHERNRPLFFCVEFFGCFDQLRNHRKCVSHDTIVGCFEEWCFRV